MHSWVDIKERWSFGQESLGGVCGRPAEPGACGQAGHQGRTRSRGNQLLGRTGLLRSGVWSTESSVSCHGALSGEGVCGPKLGGRSACHRANSQGSSHCVWHNVPDGPRERVRVDPPSAPHHVQFITISLPG